MTWPKQQKDPNAGRKRQLWSAPPNCGTVLIPETEQYCATRTQAARGAVVNSLSIKSTSRARRIALSALLVVVSVPSLLALWSLAARLLNAKSDLSVLFGYALSVAILISAGAVIYVFVTAFVPPPQLGGGPGEESLLLEDGERPKSLFPETFNTVEHFDENDRSKLFRE